MPDIVPIPTPPAPDTPPKPPSVPEPSWLHKLFTSLLPQFIAYSRKGLIWMSVGGGGTALLEFVKSIGNAQGWTEAQMTQWNWRIAFLQGLVVFVARSWTDQITKEDAALKTGLPPPPVILPVQGLPPAPPRGEGD